MAVQMVTTQPRIWRHVVYNSELRYVNPSRSYSQSHLTLVLLRIIINEMGKYHNTMEYGQKHIVSTQRITLKTWYALTGSFKKKKIGMEYVTYIVSLSSCLKIYYYYYYCYCLYCSYTLIFWPRPPETHFSFGFMLKALTTLRFYSRRDVNSRKVTGTRLRL